MIIHLSRFPPNEKRKVLFDTQLWLKCFLDQSSFLQGRLVEQSDPVRATISKSKRYVRFFNDFVRADTTTPKVVLPAVLLSEIINAYLRRIMFPRYQSDFDYEIAKWIKEKEKNKERYDLFKEHYRTSIRFSQDFRMLRRFMHYASPYLILMPDEFGVTYHFDSVLDYTATSLDFNDNYYCVLARKNNWIIITDDGDFRDQPDLDIYTLNTKLLRYG